MPHVLKKNQKTEFMKENGRVEIDTAKEIVIEKEIETGNVVDIETGKLFFRIKYKKYNLLVIYIELCIKI